MDSGGVSDFLRQIPTGLIVIFCGSGLLLLITLGYVINLRSRRARGAVPPVSATPSQAYSDEAAADLPDLDALASAEIMQPAAPPRPAGTFSIALADGEIVDVVEMFTVMRHASDGGLIIRIGDKAYRNPPAVADGDFKRRFHSTLRDLNSAQRPVEPKRASAEAAAPAQADVDMPPIAAAPLESARLSPYEPAPGDLPKFKMPEGPPVKPKRGQRPVAEPIPEINIAASIETFLQHKLMKSGQYGNRSIHVRPALNGSVKIEVDGLFYESIAEVEDEDVRQYLTATIEEWQSRQ